jgi:hypothetical protein
MRYYLCALVWVSFAGLADAKPPAPALFCEQYPDAPVCRGSGISCNFCHSSVPSRNLFGAAVEAGILPGAPRPLSDGDFAAALPLALSAAEAADSDGDGIANGVELTLGSNPSDGKDFPRDLTCAGKANPQYKACEYDLRFAYKRVMLDFCGHSPTFEQLEAFAARSDAVEELDSQLDACLGSEFWIGKNGQLWQMANVKIRPVGSLKAGPEETGDIPLADYDDDYALFTWSHIGDHDVRDVLLADFYVQRQTNPTRYSSVETLPIQFVAKDKRAGNITSGWMLSYFVMFTALPRNIAAQTYRAYLGLDIAKQEGLMPVAGEPVDYDGKGVTQTTCAACHSTLDPLTYVFRNYNGLTGGNNYENRYVANRIELGFPDLVAQTPSLANTPENGVILGQPVANLREWATVAANSDAFAMNVVRDYWQWLLGETPRAEDDATFTSLWQNLKGAQNYRVRAMLHDFIRTEAYGAP